MSVLKIKNKQGVWEEIQTINGKDGIDGKDGINGIDGIDGKDGIDGIDGKNAKINGVNTLNIFAGENIKLEQEGSDLTISAELSTRLATDMENIDEAGIEYINSLIDDKIGPINSQLAELTTLEESE